MEAKDIALLRKSYKFVIAFCFSFFLFLSFFSLSLSFTLIAFSLTDDFQNQASLFLHGSATNMLDPRPRCGQLWAVRAQLHRYTTAPPLPLLWPGRGVGLGMVGWP